MIPYLAAVEYFGMLFSLLPVPIRAFIVTFVILHFFLGTIQIIIKDS